ncbi:MAG: DUF427 domain-containing protein [Bacteroidota bacterium]
MKSKKPHQNQPNWLQKAREHWNHKGQKRPEFAVEPQPGQRSVWDFPRPPAIEAVDKPVCILYQGETLVQTNDALAVLETASPPTYYVPPKDIKLDLLVQVPNKTSLCEWKGSATYWALAEQPSLAVAWSYANPFTEFATLKDYLGFYPQHLECYVNDERVTPQPGRFYAGWITSDLTGPFKGETGTGHW